MNYPEAPAFKFGNSSRLAIRSGESAPISARKGNNCSKQPIVATSPLTDRDMYPSWSFGKSSRYQLCNGQSPSPASYTPSKLMKEHTSYSFGHANRSIWLQSNLTPGPGAYNISPIHDKKSCHFSKKPSEIRISTPGPASYKPRHPYMKQSPTISIGNGKRVTPKIYNTPGVGRYNVSPGLNNKSYSVGRSARYKESQSYEPGPGAYSIPSTIATRTIAKFH